MQTDLFMSGADLEDARLVNASLGGDRDAFAHIVARYQSLVASIAYSATGSLAQSEDLAQETFLAAWRHLKSLDEPRKLRAWLCGIARRTTANMLRQQQRQPRATSLEEAADAAAVEPLPADHAISREEEAILWRSLEQIPETYREPLILFYRENQSIERVAESLDLSNDAVRQRLSRGRKLLEERVAAFVEGALRQSVPGRSFTAQVLGVLPIQMATASVASASATAAKATKAASLLVSLTALISFLPGGVSTFLGYRTDLAEAGSEEGRRAVRRFYAVLGVTTLLPVLLVYLAVAFRGLAQNHPSLFSGLIIAIAFSWLPGALLSLALFGRRFDPHLAGSANTAVLEYRSPAAFLGLSLLHLRFGGRQSWRSPVKAWIALGDVAFGGLFAFGGIAIAPISLGGWALGLVVLGGFAAGALTYAGFGLGIWAMGGFVIGWWSVGGCAVASAGSVGGIAIAREFAVGGIAIAGHANDAAAQSFVATHRFFPIAYRLLTTWLWPSMIALTVPSIFLAIARRRKKTGVA